MTDHLKARLYIAALAACVAAPVAYVWPYVYTSFRQASEPEPGGWLVPLPPDTCATLACMLEAEGVPYPATFARIAWAETHAGATGVGRQGNLFGMRCHDRPTQCGCAAGYGVYTTPRDAIADLAAWCALSPPLRGEGPYCYLRRRGWVPDTELGPYLTHLSELAFVDTMQIYLPD